MRGSTLYRDIQTISNFDPAHFRLSICAETYMLDLKERLTPEVYDHAWERVYPRSGVHE